MGYRVGFVRHLILYDAGGSVRIHTAFVLPSPTWVRLQDEKDLNKPPPQVMHGLVEQQGGFTSRRSLQRRSVKKVVGSEIDDPLRKETKCHLWEL